MLDLSFIRELTAPCYADGLGRPSIDPEVYFRMQLVAYLYGIQSERRLCEDVYCNMAYRWFCRLSPDDIRVIRGHPPVQPQLASRIKRSDVPTFPSPSSLDGPRITQMGSWPTDHAEGKRAFWQLFREWSWRAVGCVADV